MSASILPQDNKVYGTWLSAGPGDVHVYMQGGTGVVIGQNKDYNDGINYSDMALVFNPDGSVRFQYADENGQPQFKDVPAAVAQEAIMDLLFAVKGKVV